MGKTSGKRRSEMVAKAHRLMISTDENYPEQEDDNLNLPILLIALYAFMVSLVLF